MRSLATVTLTLAFGLTFGQSFTYPVVQVNGRDITSFVPEGWIVLDSAYGDLNFDKIDDIALVLQNRDSVSIVTNSKGRSDSVVTKPRILLLAFYNISTKQFDLIEQSNSFILNHVDRSMDDPFKKVSISSGVVKIDFSIWYSMGSWFISNHSYKFRYQDMEFTLIGADSYSMHRGSGEMEERSYNFLSGKVKIWYGDIESDKRRSSRRVLNIKDLRNLKTFKEPFTYEVENGFYL